MARTLPVSIPCHRGLNLLLVGCQYHHEVPGAGLHPLSPGTQSPTELRYRLTAGLRISLHPLSPGTQSPTSRAGSNFCWISKVGLHPLSPGTQSPTGIEVSAQVTMTQCLHPLSPGTQSPTFVLLGLILSGCAVSIPCHRGLNLLQSRKCQADRHQEGKSPSPVTGDSISYSRVCLTALKMPIQVSIPCHRGLNLLQDDSVHHAPSIPFSLHPLSPGTQSPTKRIRSSTSRWHAVSIPCHRGLNLLPGVSVRVAYVLSASPSPVTGDSISYFCLLWGSPSADHWSPSPVTGDSISYPKTSIQNG